MQFSQALVIRALRNGAALVAICFCAAAQNPPAKDNPANEIKGIPPRSTPSDYQTQAKVGNYTLAAEFMGHSVPTPEATYSTEDYVIVEAALFGPPDSKVKISSGDFTLRINGKKSPLSSEPCVVVFESLKDPQWEPPAQEQKSKTSIGSGGQQQDNTPPVPPKMPMELRHVMQQRVQKSELPEGERSLPQDGLLFFQFHGKAKNIKSIELVYNGPAGTATVPLQP